MVGVAWYKCRPHLCANVTLAQSRDVGVAVLMYARQVIGYDIPLGDRIVPYDPRQVVVAVDERDVFH